MSSILSWRQDFIPGLRLLLPSLLVFLKSRTNHLFFREPVVKLYMFVMYGNNHLINCTVSPNLTKYFFRTAIIAVI